MEDLAQKLQQKIERSQSLLLKMQDPKCNLSHKAILQELNDILDNGVLATLKKRADIRQLLEGNEKDISPC